MSDFFVSHSVHLYRLTVTSKQVSKKIYTRCLEQTRTSLTEQFDSGMFDYGRVSVQTAATQGNPSVGGGGGG